MIWDFPFWAPSGKANAAKTDVAKIQRLFAWFLSQLIIWRRRGIATQGVPKIWDYPRKICTNSTYFLFFKIFLDFCPEMSRHLEKSSKICGEKHEISKNRLVCRVCPKLSWAIPDVGDPLCRDPPAAPYHLRSPITCNHFVFPDVGGHIAIVI